MISWLSQSVAFKRVPLRRGNVDFGKVAEKNEPLIQKAARNLMSR